jgi:hypothetical protein
MTHSYTLRVEKQGRPKWQGGWCHVADAGGHYHWYKYGRQWPWRRRPALVVLVGDGGEIRVPATCCTVDQALAWLQPRGATHRQGHLYFAPLSTRGQAACDARGPLLTDAPIDGDTEHCAELVSEYRGDRVVSGAITHGSHARIFLPQWCRVLPPRTFRTQHRIGD